MTTVLVACPDCGTSLRRHCTLVDSSTCDLVRCPNPECLAYGTPDGRRWTRKPQP